MCAALTSGAQAPPSIPTVDQILARYVEAIGGRTAIEKVTTRVMVGTWENERARLVRPIAIYAKAPDKRVQILGLGEASQGFNGTTGWSLNMSENGLRELTGAGLAGARRQAVFYGDLTLKELYTTLTFAGRGKIGGHETYIVDASQAEGNIQKLHFDAQSGLLIRRDGIATITKDGQSLTQVAVEMSLEDYRAVDGINLPFTIRQKFAGPAGTISIKFRDIKHNVPIDDETFAVPEP